MRSRLALALFVLPASAALALSACGGGGDETETAPISTGGPGAGGGAGAGGGSSGSSGKGGAGSAGASGGSGGTAGAGGAGGAGAAGASGAAGSGGAAGAKPCGGDLPQPCDANEYCDYTPNSCGAADQGGLCQPRPDACPASCSVPGVCGCDGKSYCNECTAHAAGVDVTGGPCAGGMGGAAGTGGEAGSSGSSGGATCGGEAGLPCGPEEYCDYGDPLCGGADGLGVCMPRPQQCPLSCTAEGICGCDGKSYCNPCEAHANGVDDTGAPCGGGTGGAAGAGGSAGSSGAAGSSGGQPCGGKQGLKCGPGEFCDYTGPACGAADNTGVCTPTPQQCPLGCTAQGICGCDGKSYCNACEAHANGVDDTGAPCPGGGGQGTPCSDASSCQAGLACCYPCGIPGCQNVCTVPGPDGQCPLVP